MLWIKSLHLLFMITWFAGLFFLPLLFVYHAMAHDRISIERFKGMERKLFWGIMTPGGVLTVGFGAWLWSGIGFGFSGGWLHWKLLLVGLVVAYHLWCYLKLNDFRRERNRHGHVYYRWMNEAPVLLLAGIILLTVFKPV